jgi:hypothetical protein
MKTNGDLEREQRATDLGSVQTLYFKMQPKKNRSQLYKN